MTVHIGRHFAQQKYIASSEHTTFVKKYFKKQKWVQFIVIYRTINFILSDENNRNPLIM